MMTRAFVFPGQGSQAVGMGKALAEAAPAAKLAFEEVDEALKQNLSRLMFHGPEDELVLTENAQPALMAMSVAVVRVLESEGGVEFNKACALVAGHSLGEYSALTAARAFSLADAARLLKRRGQAMQRAVPLGEGAMVAILGLALDEVREIAADSAAGEVCDVANDNAPDQSVLSGAAAAVGRAATLAAARGAKRTIRLPVSAPFHCALMAPAAEEMEQALADTSIAAPLVPIVSNVTAQAERDPDTIRRLLVDQICAMVRWRECVLSMREQGIDTLIELGAGKVLSSLVRRVDRDITTHSVQTPADIDSILAIL